MKKIASAAFLLCIFFATTALAVELSADVVTKSKYGASSSRMYLKADKFRADPQGQSGYHIIRQDRKVMWIVLPESRSYMEIRFNQDQRSTIREEASGELSRELVGTEVIDGHPTRKYEITYMDESNQKQIYQWLATDIDFPVKVSAVDGSWSSEYKNINTGPLSDHIFEIPAGYEKMSAPEMQVKSESGVKAEVTLHCFHH